MKEIFYYESKIGIIEGYIKNEKLVYLKLVKQNQNIKNKESDLATKIKTDINEYFSGIKKIFDVPI
ncbi:methylated-DNA--protein-cysteine methyltransferase [compost metagenome]